MAIQVQGNGGTIAEVDGTTFRALRVVSRPLDYGALGHYQIGVPTGAYVALAANAIMFSMRWGDTTRFCVLYKAACSVAATIAATAAAHIRRELIIVRGFTVSDTAQTTINLTGNVNTNKARTSMGTSLMTDMRVMGGSGITAGTGTADTNAFAAVAGAMGTGALTTTPNFTLIPYTELLKDDGGSSHPIVLATNEGARWLNNPAGPATASLISTFHMGWAEVTAY